MEDDKEVLCLNRVCRYVDEVGLEMEPGPRHAELIVAECGAQRSKGVNTPG